MKTQLIKEKINNGYKIRVQMQPNKNYTQSILKTYLIHENPEINIVYPIYYNHCKSLLNNDQILLIELFNKVKKLSYRDLVELNIKKNNNCLSKDEISLLTVYQSYKKKELLYQD